MQANQTNRVFLTKAETRMMMEALAMWACEISTVRHALHQEKIKSVQAKLQDLLDSFDE